MNARIFFLALLLLGANLSFAQEDSFEETYYDDNYDDEIGVNHNDNEEDSSTCDVEGLYYDGLYADQIGDTNKPGVIHEIKTKNVKDLSFVDSKYLTSKFENSLFIVSLTDAYKNYEENEVNSILKATVKGSCMNGDPLEFEFQQPIQFSNNHAPKFDQDTYEFVFYGDLHRNFELTNLMIAINVTDVDIDSGSTVLTVDPDREITTFTKEIDNKRHVMGLRNKDIWEAPMEKSYTLTYRDCVYCDEPHETNATLKVILKEPNDKLEFTKKSYRFSVNNNTIRILDEPISLVNGVDSEVHVELLESEYSSYFSVETDLVDGTIRLILDDELPKAPISRDVDGGSFPLKIKAFWKHLTAETEIVMMSNGGVALICYTPGLDLEDEEIWSDQVDDDFIGSVYNLTQINNVRDITCHGSKYLTCSFDKTKGEFKISTNDEFKTYEDNEIDSVIKTDVSIQCPYETIKMNFVQEIRDINNHEPKFHKEEYTFIFYDQIPEEYELTQLSEIIVSDKDLHHSSFYFTMPESVDDFFSMPACYVKNKTCYPKLYSNVEVPVGFDQTFKVKVQDDRGERQSSEATFTIKVLKDNDAIFNFTEEVYHVKFNKETHSVEQLDKFELPELQNGFDKDTRIEITPKEYAEAFTIKKDQLSGKFILSANKNAVVVCYNCDYIPLKIRATLKGQSSEVTIRVVMNDDYEPGKKPETTTPKYSSTSPTDNTTSIMEPIGIDALSGFRTFVTTTTIGVVSIFVSVTLTLLGLLYVARRLFFTPCMEPEDDDVESVQVQHVEAGPLPEKIPI